MRIAVVETAGHGGLLHYAAQLADGLACEGHDVDLLVPRDHELPDRPVLAGPGPHRHAATRAVLVLPVRTTSPSPAAGPAKELRRVLIGLRLLRSVLRVLRECWRGRYDVVVLQWEILFGLFSLATRALLRMPGRPRVVFVLHNVRPFDRWGGEGVFLHDRRSDARMRALLPRFDLVVLHGERSREAYKQAWPAARVAVVPHGDESLVADGPAPDAVEPRALFFGGWHTVKGLPVLLEAFDLVVARLPGARLTIAGAPAPADFDDEVVRRWAAQHEGRVRLDPRYVPLAEVPALFAEARVVVTPYLAGYQSGVVHLAMTLGRAVICSDVGDLPRAVVAGETGLVVPAGDVEALADALVQLLDDPVTAARYGSAGRRRIGATSSWQAVARALEPHLLDVVGAGGPSR